MKKNDSLRKFVAYILPLLLWMGFIFFMSTDRGAASNTRPVVNSILRRIFPTIDQHLTPAQIERVDWNIRKIAHVTEYSILAILAFRAVSYGDSRFRHRNVILPIVIGVAYAASDEYHQSFSKLRDGAASDVFFDSFGVLLGTLLCQWRHLTVMSQTGTASRGKRT